VLRVTGPRDRECGARRQKKYHIERLIGEGDVRSIEHFDRDVSVVAEQHIDATDGEIGPPGLKNSGDKAIAAADVEHAGGGRSKLGKPSGDGFDSAVEDQLLVQDSDGAHGICSVQRDAGEKARQTRDLCAVCRKKRDPLARFTCSGRLLFSQKTRALRMTMKLIQSRSEIRGTKRTESRREITGWPFIMRMNWSCWDSREPTGMTMHPPSRS